MTTQARMTINLVAGERRQLLLDPGSTLFVASGQVLVTSPFGWLAERVHQTRTVVDAEDHIMVESGGWVELSGLSATQVIVIPSETVSLWSRIGRSLEKLLATSRSTATSSNIR